jgi:hypothetical protein
MVAAVNAASMMVEETFIRISVTGNKRYDVGGDCESSSLIAPSGDPHKQ